MLRCNQATIGPPSPLPHPTPSIATKSPTTLPRQLLLPHWTCPCNCFWVSISSGSFLSLLPRRGWGWGLRGWNKGGEQGCVVQFQSPKTCTYNQMSKSKSGKSSAKTLSFFLLLLNVISPKWKPVCQSCPAPNERHAYLWTLTSVHIHRHTHSETNNEENKVFLSVGGSVGYTRWDRAKLRLAFPLSARCWICIWIQLWGPRFMPLWALPSRVFFPPGFLSLSPILSLIIPNCVELLTLFTFSSHFFWVFIYHCKTYISL